MQNFNRSAIALSAGAVLLGLWFSPLLIGVCLGYILGYHLILQQKNEPPRLWPLEPLMKRYILVSTGVVCLLALLITPTLPSWDPMYIFDFSIDPAFSPDQAQQTDSLSSNLMNLVIVGMTLYAFFWWRKRILVKIREQLRHGSARYATKRELQPYAKQKEDTPSIYIGGGKYFYQREGHLISVAGTRSGKGTNLIIPNLLGAGTFNGSIVVIDPKGENAAVTARYQRLCGRQVRILNPWGLLDLPNSTYNPFDLISDSSSEHLPDDAQLLAQMIVPSLPGQDDHWNNRARSLISAVLMHMATALPASGLTAGQLWRLLRLPSEDWLQLLKDMALNSHPVSGPIINGAANEILSIIENSEKEATSIISTAQRWTDIFKSIPLQRSLQSSSFNINELSDGNTILYVIIPADKLKSHYAWLRLVVTTAMKAVVRRPNQRVLFLLDEFYALGYLQEIEVALGTYAGFGITVWTILQSLVQLQDLYGKNWENFIGNSSVIHAFGLNDHTTAQYFSDLAGRMSVPTYSKEVVRGVPHGSSMRALLTPDEARRLGDHMLVFVDNLPASYLPKVPYYDHPQWSQWADPNPYYRG